MIDFGIFITLSVTILGIYFPIFIDLKKDIDDIKEIKEPSKK